MSTALSNQTVNLSDGQEEKEAETFNKLLNLEQDLIILRNLLGEVKKIKNCCSQTDELKEINASRKK